MNKNIKKDINKNDNKDFFLQIRVTSTEKKLIKDNAKELESSISDYLRKIIFDYKVRPNKVGKKIIQNIARIASNINQIARHANTYKNDSDSLYIFSSLAIIEEEIHEVRKNVNKDF